MVRARWCGRLVRAGPLHRRRPQLLSVALHLVCSCLGCSRPATLVVLDLVPATGNSFLDWLREDQYYQGITINNKLNIDYLVVYAANLFSVQ